MATTSFAAPQPHTPCSFERIYFSRGNDPEIYRERKAMGAALVAQVVGSIDGAFDKTVFSFIPNTAETAYHGLMDGLRMHRREEVRAAILKGYAGKVLPLDNLAAYLVSHYGADRAHPERSDTHDKSDKATTPEKNERTPVSTPRA